MQPYPPTIVFRHRRENLKKCSLRGLEPRPDFRFFTYPKDKLPPLDGYVMLVMEGAPVISPADAELGLFMLDATWRYAEVMMKQIERDIAICQPRTLPTHFKTAYPRRQDDCSDPERGLASVEAIYLAYHLMGRDTQGILDAYHWKDQFLQNNF